VKAGLVLVPPLSTSSHHADPFPSDALPPADFAISLTFEPECTVVAVRGELDILTTLAFGAFLDVAGARARFAVVIDLAEVTFIGAGGLGQVARALCRLGLEGRELAITAPSRLAYRLLDITGFTSVMRIDQGLPAPSAGAPRRPRAAALASGCASRGVDEVLEAALRVVVDLAATAVGLADGASLTLAVGDELATVVASNEVIAAMDADQYSLHEGPCVSAATVGEGFYIESMASEARWPAFASRAYQRGINSVISTPLILEGGPVGALNIYSRTSRAFAPPQGKLAWQLASQAAAVLEAHASEQTAAGDRPVALGAMLDRRTCAERRRVLEDGAHGDRRASRGSVGARAAPPVASAPVTAPLGARSS
jgi:anti-anti-sigma factor